MNVVLFGDSLLGRFNQTLINQFEETIPSSTVYNCAAGGWNTQDGIKRAEYISKLNPDTVIMSFGANDASPWKKQTTLSVFEHNIDFMLRAFKNSKVIMLICPHADIGTPEQTMEFNNSLDKYNQVIRHICDKHHTGYIDTDNLLSSIDDYHDDDGVHLNKAAYDLVIKELGQCILKEV